MTLLGAESPTTMSESDYDKLYDEMVKVYLKAAEKRLRLEIQERIHPRLVAGEGYTITYTAVYEPDSIDAIARKAGVTLPKLRIYQ